MHGFKSAILSTPQFFQNGTFEPMHEISNKKISIMCNQVPPNPGFMQEKAQKVDFLKKSLRELILFYFITQRPGMLNWK